MEDIRENIILKATEMFLQFGIRSVSIDNVCNELHISKKTFYNYFIQKENLIEAVLQYQLDDAYDKFSKLTKNKNAIEALIIIVREIRKGVNNQSQPMCYDMKKYYPVLDEKYNIRRKEVIKNGFEENLNQGISEGYYRDNMDVELIALFHSMQIGNTFEQIMKNQKKYSKKQLLDFYIDLIIHLIANEKGLQYVEENYLSNLDKD